MNRLQLSRQLTPRDGIGLYLIERLGNQLFMYAAALEQARRLDCPVYLNLACYRRRPKPDRAYSLDAFDHGMIVRSNAGDDPILLRAAPLHRGTRLWYQTVRPHVLGGRVHVERSFRFDPSVNTIERGTTLLGYFQSWRYFPTVADEVRRRMTALRAPSAWCLDASRAIRDSRGTVILNVRRGDYTIPRLQANYGLATRWYYERALGMLRAQGFDGPALVVSDQLDLAMEELAGIDKQLEPFDPPRGTHPLEIVVAMSNADAIVMANSSFSWWAAWLGERPDRPVFAPRPWFNNPALDERDLLLPGWVSLGRDDD